MKEFGQLASAFSEWKQDNDIEIGFNDSRGYFWRMGKDAKESWEVEFERAIPDATTAEIAAFREMFVEGGELLGIPVAKSLGDFRGIRLYKMNEKPQSFAVNNMLVAYDGTVLPAGTSNTINDPDTGEVFTPPIIIKPETLTMNGPFDGVDVIASKTSGLVYGAGLRNQQRSTNRKNGESIMGTFDYRDGNIQLIRSNNTNDRLLPQYEQFVREYIAAYGDGSDTTVVPPEGTYITPPSGELVNINFTLGYTVFGNPVTSVWEFMLD